MTTMTERNDPPADRGASKLQKSPPWRPPVLKIFLPDIQI